MKEYPVENFLINSNLIPFRSTQEVCDHIGLVIPEKPIIKETIEQHPNSGKFATWANGRHGSYHILLNDEPFWIYRTKKAYLRLSDACRPVTPAVGWDRTRVPSSRFTKVFNRIMYNVIMLYENEDGVSSIYLDIQIPVMDQQLGRHIDTCFVSYGFNPKKDVVNLGTIYFGSSNDVRVWRQIVENSKWETYGRQNFLKNFQHPVRMNVSGVHIDPVDSFFFRESTQT